MPLGFETYDPSGKLQITSELLIYVLRVSGTTFVENQQVGNTCPTSFRVPTTQTFTEALVAIGGGNGYAAAFAGTWVSGERIFGTNAPVGTAFNYFVFERSNTYPATNFGIEVRRPTGEIVFSTSQRVMRVVQILDLPTGDDGEVTVPGRQLAWCQGAWAAHRIAGPLLADNGGGPIIVDPGTPGEGGQVQYRWQNDGKIYGGCLANGGATVRSAKVSYDDVMIGPTADPNQPPDYLLPLKLFIVDVTGVPVGVQFY